MITSLITFEKIVMTHSEVTHSEVTHSELITRMSHSFEIDCEIEKCVREPSQRSMRLILIIIIKIRRMVLYYL